MKPVTPFLDLDPKGLPTIKATPVATAPRITQLAPTTQPPQKAPERKQLHLKVERVYEIDLSGQPSSVQKGLLPGSVTCSAQAQITLYPYLIWPLPKAGTDTDGSAESNRA